MYSCTSAPRSQPKRPVTDASLPSIVNGRVSARAAATAAGKARRVMDQRDAGLAGELRRLDHEREGADLRAAGGEGRGVVAVDRARHGETGGGHRLDHRRLVAQRPRLELRRVAAGRARAAPRGVWPTAGSNMVQAPAGSPKSRATRRSSARSSAPSASGNGRRASQSPRRHSAGSRERSSVRWGRRFHCSKTNPRQKGKSASMIRKSMARHSIVPSGGDTRAPRARDARRRCRSRASPCRRRTAAWSTASWRPPSARTSAPPPSVRFSPGGGSSRGLAISDRQRRRFR